MCIRDSLCTFDKSKNYEFQVIRLLRLPYGKSYFYLNAGRILCQITTSNDFMIHDLHTSTEIKRFQLKKEKHLFCIKEVRLDDEENKAAILSYFWEAGKKERKFRVQLLDLKELSLEDLTENLVVSNTNLKLSYCKQGGPMLLYPFPEVSKTSVFFVVRQTTKTHEALTLNYEKPFSIWDLRVWSEEKFTVFAYQKLRDTIYECNEHVIIQLVFSTKGDLLSSRLLLSISERGLDPQILTIVGYGGLTGDNWLHVYHTAKQGHHMNSPLVEHTLRTIDLFANRQIATPLFADQQLINVSQKDGVVALGHVNFGLRKLNRDHLALHSTLLQCFKASSVTTLYPRMIIKDLMDFIVP
eukprot:TRINITY_DN30807_c0_g2_i1.p1 TRINITY_DN30807_c0_g2~~TRINITY_DN30807_c0_g2_i1.p1  ORF type:complete len:375 (+),score=53.75 TRINITY_DN30807_c0_g2_i1:61-1125(+)